MMALGMRVRWKIPVYLHQTRAITADQQKILIMAAIDALQEQNMHVPEVRFDGAATNMLATKKLGCDYENEKYYFVYESRQIFVTLWMQATCSKFFGKIFLHFQWLTNI